MYASFGEVWYIWRRMKVINLPGRVMSVPSGGYIPALVDRVRFLIDFFASVAERAYWPWIIVIIVLLGLWTLRKRERP